MTFNRIQPKSILNLTRDLNCICYIRFNAPFSDAREVTLPRLSQLRIGASSLRKENYSFTLIESKSDFEIKYLSDYIINPYFAGYSFEASPDLVEKSCSIAEQGNLDKLDLSLPEDRTIFVYLYNDSLLSQLPMDLQNEIQVLNQEYDDILITRNEWRNKFLFLLERFSSPYMIYTIH